MTNTPEATPTERAKELATTLSWLEATEGFEGPIATLTDALSAAEARGEARGREESSSKVEALERQVQRLSRDREQTLRNAHRLLRHKYRHEYLWSFITDVCAVGSTSAIELCRELGWDPHQNAGKDLPSQWATV